MIRLTCTAALIALGSTALTGAGASAQERRPSADEAQMRAERTLAQMTQDEKVQLIHGTMAVVVPKPRRPRDMPMGAGVIAGVERLGIPPQYATDASLGISNIMDMRKGDVATALPSGLSLASTWNPALLRAGGRMIGSEALAKGFNVMLAGGVNLVRDPRAGRNFEYLGEDPLLGGVLVGAQIEGIQSNGIIATIKHFALNNQETGRATASVNMGEAAMRESDLLAFQIGIERGDPGSVMCSYNKVGGIYACENSFMLNDVLRRDWGFKGYVMSDWGAVHSTEALLAGLDQQSGETVDAKRWLSTELRPKLADGRIPAAALDTAVKRILWAIYAKELDKTPLGPKPIDYAKNAEVALQAAREGTVLLRNEGALLPLAKTVRSVVVIGGKANLGVPSGGGSSQVVPVGGFRVIEKLSDGAAAVFSRRAWGGSVPLAALQGALGGVQVTYLDGSDAQAAAVAAKAADVAIVFATKFSTEAEDQADLVLDGAQDALIDMVASANPRTVVVLETGNPVAMPWLGKVPVVLSAWYSGQRGADAIADIIAGTVNPSGRLPVTFPASVAQLPNPKLPGADLPPPSKEDKIRYGVNTNSPPFNITYPEGSDAGYRWFDRTGQKPLFAFGHGLSYTMFRYSRLKVKGGRTLRASFTVTNTGGREGADVPQVYVTLPGKARRLVGWDKPMLKRGESRTITVMADPRLLADFDMPSQRWVVKPGKVKVELARSATEPVLSTQATLSAQKLKP
ncbi:glycosyl hydrolase [Novosphingobium sp. ERN07]|uniref:glycoside hydrolase family 3 C-terminal domain-containing protein n=1 Tax=Novosphingobium sp. ERN07 TaxID=2726187 RepID=UPI001456FE4E|nr:glycoside hydrolase family 3 C-terminal domain-containing protein [Novosphingobium sp. ERN07]NLR73132.1 glycosyl hydrolase [Novosphingobium sp. ERN07]